MLDKHEDEFIRMGVPNMQGGLSEDEVEVAQIYCVLVLKRVSITHAGEVIWMMSVMMLMRWRLMNMKI